MTLTIPSRSYSDVQRRNKICENGIHLIQTSQNIYYIGTWICVFLWEDWCKKGSDGLYRQPCAESRDTGSLHQEHAHLLEHFLL